MFSADASVMHMTGDDIAALDDLTRALDIDPCFAKALFRRGLVHMDLARKRARRASVLLTTGCFKNISTVHPKSGEHHTPATSFSC